MHQSSPLRSFSIFTFVWCGVVMYHFFLIFASLPLCLSGCCGWRSVCDGWCLCSLCSLSLCSQICLLSAYLFILISSRTHSAVAGVGEYVCLDKIQTHSDLSRVLSLSSLSFIHHTHTLVLVRTQWFLYEDIVYCTSPLNITFSETCWQHLI